MTQFTFRCSSSRIAVLVSLGVVAACGGAEPAATESAEMTPASTAGSSATSTPAQPSAAGSAGRAPITSSQPQPQRAGAAAPAAAGTGGVATQSSAGGSGSAAGSGAVGTQAGATAAVGGAAAGAGGASAAAAAGQGAAGSSAGDATSFAAGLNELFIDATCDSATRAPLEQGATCNHSPNTQRIEKMVSFGGEAGKSYKVTLRVRGVWEPTNVTGGMRPYKDVPFTVGGQVAMGAGSSSDSINYQQYFIEVAEPKQIYWLNDHQYVAHDIHKEDYEASLTVAGGSQIKVVMNDGNEREIANFPKEMFSDLPPYDKTPSLGQLLRLDVVSVEAAP